MKAIWLKLKEIWLKVEAVFSCYSICCSCYSITYCIFFWQLPQKKFINHYPFINHSAIFFEPGSVIRGVVGSSGSLGKKKFITLTRLFAGAAHYHWCRCCIFYLILWWLRTWEIWTLWLPASISKGCCIIVISIISLSTNPTDPGLVTAISNNSSSINSSSSSNYGCKKQHIKRKKSASSSNTASDK